MMRRKLKIPTQSRQARSTHSSEGGIKLYLTSPSLLLFYCCKEKIRVQTQRQEVKGKVEVRHANENRKIKRKPAD